MRIISEVWECFSKTIPFSRVMSLSLILFGLILLGWEKEIIGGGVWRWQDNKVNMVKFIDNVLSFLCLWNLLYTTSLHYVTHR